VAPTIGAGGLICEMVRGHGRAGLRLLTGVAIVATLDCRNRSQVRMRTDHTASSFEEGRREAAFFFSVKLA
jgi:hypothetical protein